MLLIEKKKWYWDTLKNILAHFTTSLFFFLLLGGPVHAEWTDGAFGVTPNGTDAIDVTYSMPVDDGTASSTFDRTGCSAGVRPDGSQGGNALYAFLHYYITDDGTPTGILESGGYVVSEPLTVGVSSSTYSWTISGLPVPAMFMGAGLLCATPAIPPYEWPIKRFDFILLEDNVNVLNTSYPPASFDTGNPVAGSGVPWLQWYTLGISGTFLGVLDFSPTTDFKICTISTRLTLWGGSQYPSPSIPYYMQIVELDQTGTASTSLIAISDNFVDSATIPIEQSFVTSTFTFGSCVDVLAGLRYGIMLKTSLPLYDGINAIVSFRNSYLAPWTNPFFVLNTFSLFHEDPSNPDNLGAFHSSSTDLLPQMQISMIGTGSNANFYGQQLYDGPISILDTLTASSTSLYSNLYTSSTGPLCNEFGSAWVTNGIGGFGGALVDCIVDIAKYLFYPNRESLANFKVGAGVLGSRAPFGYAGQFASATRAIFSDTSSNSSTVVSLVIPAGPYNSNATQTMTLFDTGTIKTKVEPLISPIRATLGTLLWFAFLAALYEWAVHHARPE